MEETHTKPTLCRGPQPVGVLQWPRRLQMAARQQRNEYGGERTRKRMKERDGFLLGGETTPHHSKDRNDEENTETRHTAITGRRGRVFGNPSASLDFFPVSNNTVKIDCDKSKVWWGKVQVSSFVSEIESVSLSLCKRGGSVCKNIRLVSTASSRQLSEERRMNVGWSQAQVRRR